MGLRVAKQPESSLRVLIRNILIYMRLPNYFFNYPYFDNFSAQKHSEQT